MRHENCLTKGYFPGQKRYLNIFAFSVSNHTLKYLEILEF